MLSLDRQNHWREIYRAQNQGWQPATERFADTVRAHLTPHSRVLDLGCGRGGLVEQLTHPLEKVIGADPDWHSLHEHRLGLQGAVSNERLPFAAATFDLIYASWVLEHWARPVQSLAEIRRVLKPGGAFIFITPNKHNPLIRFNQLLTAVGGLQSHLVAAVYGRVEADTFPVFYRASTPSDLHRLARQSGLIMHVLDMIPDPTYLAFNRPLFALFSAAESAIAAESKLHLVGTMTKP